MKNVAASFVVILSLFSLQVLGAAPGPDSNSPSSPSQPPPTYREAPPTLDGYMNSEIAKFSADNGNMGLAVATILNGRTQKYYFGETVKGSGQKPGGDTVFLLASVSKTFTGALLAYDMEKNLVSLTDALQNFLPQGVTAPFFNGDSAHPITLEMLATHTSGFPLMPVLTSYAGATSPDDVLNAVKLTALGSTPGTAYLYSNFGFALLGQALAHLENRTYDDLIQERITGPLGMVDTKAESKMDADEIARKTPGYNPVAGEWTFFPGEVPAGGLYSTLDDMVKYLAYVMGQTGSSLNSLLPLMFQPRFQERPGVKIGLSWDLSTLPGTMERIIWKGGSLNGFKSYVGFLPDKGVGVVFLLNSEAVDETPVAEKTLAFLLTNPAQPIQLRQQAPRYPIQIPQGPGPVEGPQYIH